MNRYYLLTLTSEADTRFQAAKNRGLNDGRPHQRAHWRWNLLHTQIILQAQFTAAQVAWLEDPARVAWVQYLGDCVNGQPDRNVLGYMNLHRAEWEESLSALNEV